MTRPWLVQHADGSVSQHWKRPGSAGTARGVRRARPPREIDFAAEGWDWKRRRIVPIEGALDRVDLLHRGEQGAQSIAIAHAEKRIEARLILAGVAIDGVLAAEARATGQDVADLAATIVAKADVAKVAEITRITDKSALRAQMET